MKLLWPGKFMGSFMYFLIYRIDYCIETQGIASQWIYGTPKNKHPHALAWGCSGICCGFVFTFSG